MDLDTITILGKHFGYPECCIKSFYKTQGALGNRKGASVGEFSGFIPCPACADKIINKEVTLKGLIVDRQHPHPFPFDIVGDIPYELI